MSGPPETPVVMPPTPAEICFSSNVESDDKPLFEGGAKGGLIREVDWDGNVLIEHFDGWQTTIFDALIMVIFYIVPGKSCPKNMLNGSG